MKNVSVEELNELLPESVSKELYEFLSELK
jgi:hypothetical protein